MHAEGIAPLAQPVGPARPRADLPRDRPAQLDAVLALLDRHEMRYWVDADAISLDNEPAVTVINFGESGDAARIQAILDEAG
jgi:hypothetical protein